MLERVSALNLHVPFSGLDALTPKENQKLHDRRANGNSVQDCLLVQFLPVGFTACKHASNEGNNDTDDSDTSNNQPPDVITD